MSGSERALAERLSQGKIKELHSRELAQTRAPSNVQNRVMLTRQKRPGREAGTARRQDTQDGTRLVEAGVARVRRGVEP